jgi:hypothetical protein
MWTDTETVKESEEVRILVGRAGDGIALPKQVHMAELMGRYRQVWLFLQYLEETKPIGAHFVKYKVVLVP